MGFRQGTVPWGKFRCSDWCRNFPQESSCATWARPLHKVGQVPLIPKIWGAEIFPPSPLVSPEDASVLVFELD